MERVDHEHLIQIESTSLATEERFRLLVDAVTDYAIFMLDTTGHVVTWNPGAARISGYRADEILGEHFSRFYPVEDVRAGKCEMELEVAAREGRFEDEGWRIRKDGGRYWSNVVITAVHDDTGRLIGFGKVTRDLTERKQMEEQLRESERRFRLLVESVKDYAIFMLDPTGHVATWNAGAQRIKGYSAQDIIGQHFSKFYPVEDVRAGKCEMELEVAARDGRFEDEGWRIRKDGTRFWANVILTALRDEKGRLVGYAKVTRDLTERRRTEDERVHLAQALEAVRLRDEFLSIASHELKTPLTALYLQLQGLRSGVAGLDPKLGVRVERAIKSGARLSELIETLLDVARISTGNLTLKPERFDLGEAVREVCERFADAALAAGCPVEVRAAAGLVGLWDRLRVEQVVTNLLSNAVKYGRGKPVFVDVGRAVGRDAAGQARIEVSDHGPGVPPGERDRIFRRFERASSARHFAGLGLGLYVSAEIVKAHGGAITVDDAESGGARFTVLLPIAPA